MGKETFYISIRIDIMVKFIKLYIENVCILFYIYDILIELVFKYVVLVEFEF